MSLRRAMLPIAAYVTAFLAATACKDSTLSQCFESGGAAYNVALGGDTALTFRWPASHQPVRYYAEPKGSLPVNVDSALALWTGALRCGEINVIRVSDSTTADVVVTNPVQLPPAAAASLHADSTLACKGRTDPDLDAQDRLVLPIHTFISPQGIDSAATESCYHFVTAHEIGHTLGIFAHSPDAPDLMYTNPFRRALTTNDRFTIQTLYHLSHVGITIAP
jgi:matrixin